MLGVRRLRDTWILRAPRTRMWTFLVLGLTLLLRVHGAKEEAYDIQEYLQDLNGKVPIAEEQQVTKVKRLWGVPDTTASVGKIFNYVIPNDAFSGEIDRYVVTEAGEPALPNWLYFESETRTFRGVPTEQDVGRFYISVKAVAKSSEEEDDPLVAKDVFSIEVTDGPSYTTNRDKCPHRAVLTIMTVITDANMADLPPYRRYDLIVRMGKALELEPREVKLGTLGGEAYDDQALAAGPGSTKTRDGAGVTLKWIVGCEGKIQDTKIVASVEKLSKNGQLSAELGLPVIGWHVTNQHPPVQVRTKRINRAIHGTPVPDIVPTMWSSERIDDIESTDDTVVPESRVVPTMSSPVYYTESSSHRHRHHHMLTDRGHHNHHILPSTPVFNLYSTPVVVPVLPSKHIESSMYFPHESMESSTPAVYFTELMPSATPVITSDITPSRSYPIVEPSRQPVPNSKPTVPNRLKQLSMTAGKFWTYRIPEDTFFDFEDGGTRDLKLMFTTEENTAIPVSFWIQFDPEKQELYSLPLAENVGNHYFMLEAMDSEEAVVKQKIDIRVWNYTSTPSHTFRMVLRYDKFQYPVGIDWQIEVLKRIAYLYKDPDTSSIVVRSVTLDPVRFVWSNDTIEDGVCHRETINELFKKLATDASAPSHTLRKVMKPEFKISDIEIDLSGSCLDEFHTSPPLTPTKKMNSAPVINNPIDFINTTVGDILQFMIPTNTFHDNEDGGTRNLTLSLLTLGSQEPGRSSWIQFDQRLQMIQALPEKSHLGEHEYQIVASDVKGEKVADVFILSVKDRKSEKMVVEFNVKLNENYKSFQQYTMKKLLLARKIARMYGDADAKHMRITNISEGSVIFAWTNNTLPVDRCPKRRISQLVKKLLTDEGKIKPEFIVALQPDFKVDNVWAMPLSHCLDEKLPFNIGAPPLVPDVTPDLPPAVTSTEESTTIKPATSSDDDIYITTVIPAVVIAIMLIIAAMVACFLYRKKRKGKMTMQDTSGFMSKGVPIIFADEIEEKPDPAKPPVIMKDEKPPLSQPTYQQTDSEEATTPQIDRREPQSDPPYQPPPPFTATREAKNGRPKATPTYRQPPPYYVPP